MQRAVEETRDHEGDGHGELGTATQRGKIWRRYDDYQKGGTPSPKLNMPSPTEEYEGAGIRRYDDYHKGGTPPPSSGARSPTESYSYQSDVYGHDGFHDYYDQYDPRVSSYSESPAGDGKEMVWELPTVEVSMLEKCWHSEAKDDECNVHNEPVVEVFTVEPYDEHEYAVKPYGRASPNKLAEATRLAVSDADTAMRRANMLALVDSALVVAGGLQEDLVDTALAVTGELQETTDDGEEIICWPPKIGGARKYEMLTRVLESVVNLLPEDGEQCEEGGGPTEADEAVRRMREVSWEMLMDQSVIATMRDLGGEIPRNEVVEKNESNPGRPDAWNVFLESYGNIPADPLTPTMISDLRRPCESSSDMSSNPLTPTMVPEIRRPCESSSDVSSNDARTEQVQGMARADHNYVLPGTDPKAQGMTHGDHNYVLPGTDPKVHGMTHGDHNYVLPVVDPKGNHADEVGGNDDETSGDDSKGSLPYSWRSRKVAVKQWLSDEMYLARPPYDADDEDDSYPGTSDTAPSLNGRTTWAMMWLDTDDACPENLPMGEICTECMGHRTPGKVLTGGIYGIQGMLSHSVMTHGIRSHKAPVEVLTGGIYGIRGMLFQGMVTQECAVTVPAGGRHGMLTYETMTRGMPAGPMLECVVLTTFRNSTISQSKCTTREYAITKESRESANTRSECAILECADIANHHIATITTSPSGMLTWGMPDLNVWTQNIPVEQRNPWRQRMLTGRMPDPNVQTRRILVEQRDPGRQRIAHTCSPMRGRKTGRYNEGTTWGALCTEWASGTWAHDNHRHVLGVKKHVKFVKMGLDINFDKETWKILMGVEAAVAEAPTPHRRSGSRGRVWKTTCAYTMMLATVMCACITMYWVYQLVEKSLANYRNAVQHQFLN